VVAKPSKLKESTQRRSHIQKPNTKEEVQNSKYSSCVDDDSSGFYSTRGANPPPIIGQSAPEVERNLFDRTKKQSDRYINKTLRGSRNKVLRET
jgi:hypothetical protein